MNSNIKLSQCNKNHKIIETKTIIPNFAIKNYTSSMLINMCKQKINISLQMYQTIKCVTKYV